MKPFSTQRGACAPLTNRQKAELSRLARDAWTLLDGAGAIDEKEKEWRQREAIEACGRRISEAVNGDYEILQAHFLAKGGKTGRAFNAAMKADSNPARQARFKLDQICRQNGLTADYPAKIMRDKFRCTLDSATDRQLWAVFFDVKRNMAKRAKTAAAQVAAEADEIPY